MTQVTVEYKQKSDGSVEPLKVHTVVISTQHAAPGTAKRSEECSGYSGSEMIAPSMEQMNSLIVEHVVKDSVGDPVEERQAGAHSLRRPHPPAHQPLGQVHHR